MSRPTSSGDPHEVLAYLLKHAHLRLTELSDAALAPYGIDSKDYGVLRVIAAGEPTSQAHVAQTLSIDRTTMVALIDSLATKGIVTRRPDPDDRRRNVVELTESGETVHEQASAAYDAAERELLAPLSAAERAGLPDVLRALVSPPPAD